MPKFGGRAVPRVIARSAAAGQFRLRWPLAVRDLLRIGCLPTVRRGWLAAESSISARRPAGARVWKDRLRHGFLAARWRRRQLGMDDRVATRTPFAPRPLFLRGPCSCAADASVDRSSGTASVAADHRPAPYCSALARSACGLGLRGDGRRRAKGWPLARQEPPRTGNVIAVSRA